MVLTSCSSILFKFARDRILSREKSHYMYAGTSSEGGDDGLAMKAMAHELQAAIQISKHTSQNFIVPMQCMIDFQGFRIVV